MICLTCLISEELQACTVMQGCKLRVSPDPSQR